MLSREERQRNRRIVNRINNPEFRQKWELYCKEYDMDQYERREFISWLEKGHSIKNHYHPRFLPDTGKLSFIEGYRLDRTIKRLLREKGWDFQVDYLRDYVTFDNEDHLEELLKELNPSWIRRPWDNE
jgi:hypothetical protein